MANKIFLSKGVADMRRVAALILIMLCCMGLCCPAMGASGASGVSSDSAVTSDGKCLVSLTATLNLEQIGGNSTFPIPLAAADITLNGAAVNGTPSGQSQLLDLSGITGGAPGIYSISVNYTLPQVVSTVQIKGEDGKLHEQMQLTLPLLSGFSYPISDFSFSITLPGAFTARPAFSSGYHQTNIEHYLAVAVSGSTISGSITEPLKDHETLTMTLAVTEELFPKAAAAARVVNALDIAVIAAGLAAIIYYIIALRPTIPARFRRSTEPDGVCAGDIAGYLTGCGTDLSMLVVTWAQLGYLRIQLDDNGRVLLHKRMEMGNERSIFEMRCYKNLFGRRRIIDGTGYHYAELARQVAKKTPHCKIIYEPHSGNPKIFRALACVSGILSGIGMASSLWQEPGFMMFVLGILGGIAAWLIQSGGFSLQLRSKFPLVPATICAAAWLAVGIFSGKVPDAVILVIFQFLCGIFAALGGKRTELGKQALSQILSLRHFLRSVPKDEIKQLLKVNPGYYHALAPYALALGVDRAFARRFGRLRLPECTYLVAGMNGQMTAAEWSHLLRTVVHALDAKAKRLPLERMTGR